MAKIFNSLDGSSQDHEGPTSNIEGDNFSERFVPGPIDKIEEFFKEETFFRDLIENLPAAVYVCNLEGVILAFNKRAIAYYGRTPKVGDTEEKYCGAYKLFNLDGSALPHDQCPMARALKNGQKVIGHEAIIERPDGSRITVVANASPLYNRDGQQIGAVNCLQDITASKTSEHEKQNLQNMLHHSQKMEALGRLTGGIAHDFNNILATLKGSLELLDLKLNASKRSELDKLISIPLDSINRASSLIKQLLMFSRKQELVLQHIDVNSVVKNMENFLERAIGKENPICITTCSAQSVASLDQSQLENVLLNLCMNAKDAMPSGGTITISTSHASLTPETAKTLELDGGDYIVLKVQDTGKGMAPDIVSQACEPFFTTKPVGEGTGLGLSIVYGFAKQLGGNLHIQSTLGKQTQISLWIPRQKNIEVAPLPASDSMQTELPSFANILLVEDEEHLQTVLSLVLRNTGHSIKKAKTGRDGLALLEEHKDIDLLITDIGLPDQMNGIDFAQQARQICPELQVIFMTGYGETAEMKQLEKDYDSAVLLKPFSITAFDEAVRQALSSS